MGEEKNLLFEASFNRAVKVRSREDRLTSDAGVLLVREADHRLGLTESLASGLEDPRSQEHIRYTLLELLRERLYALSLGYRPADDLDRLAHDPVVRMAAWDRPGDRVLEERLASQPTQSRLLRILGGQREHLRSSLPDWVERHLRAAGSDRAVARGTLDVDSLPIVARGLQEGTEYNGHYRTRMYHPLVAGFAPGGDYASARVGDGFVHAILRQGHVHSASGAIEFIREAVRRCAEFCRLPDVRFDSAFTSGEIMDALTDDGTRFLGLLQRNQRLSALAEPHLTRPVGRPPKEGYEKVVELGDYEVESWKHPQRLLLVVVDKPDPTTGQLEFWPHYFFLVTNWGTEERSGEELLEHYRCRGTFEDRIGELGQAASANLSSPTFRENEVTFLLSLLAFNLVSMLRGELEVSCGTGWDLRRVQTSVLKAGARVVTKSRRLYVDVAAAVLPLWRRLLKRLERWKLPKRWSSPQGAKPRNWIPPPRHAFSRVVLRL